MNQNKKKYNTPLDFDDDGKVEEGLEEAKSSSNSEESSSTRAES